MRPKDLRILPHLSVSARLQKGGKHELLGGATRLVLNVDKIAYQQRNISDPRSYRRIYNRDLKATLASVISWNW